VAEKTRITSFRDLIAWQRGKELAVAVYAITRDFPTEERFGITVQMRRAAVSISSNIAEGYGRGSTADYLRFLRTARGSVAELMTQIEIAFELKYLEDSTQLLEQADEVDRILQGLIRSLERKASG
jgi:four helix bundle protein